MGLSTTNKNIQTRTVYITNSCGAAKQTSYNFNVTHDAICNSNFVTLSLKIAQNKTNYGMWKASETGKYASVWINALTDVMGDVKNETNSDKLLYFGYNLKMHYYQQ